MSTFVLDASVAVAAVRRAEPSHAAARARLALVLAGTDHAIVPATFDAEVTSALVRAGVSQSPHGATSITNSPHAWSSPSVPGPPARLRRWPPGPA